MGCTFRNNVHLFSIWHVNGSVALHKRSAYVYELPRIVQGSFLLNLFDDGRFGVT